MTTIARTSTISQAPMTTSATPQRPCVVVGVDTHRDTHTAAVITMTGELLGHREFTADAAGYAALMAWALGHGTVRMMGIEGTGAYGAGLTRHLTRFLRTHTQHLDVELVEVDRPNRAARRRTGKSDPLDAETAARTTLARARTGTPKDRDSAVEALRALRVARRSAVLQRADTQRRIKALLVTAPEPLRTRLRQLSATRLVKTCAALRPDPDRAADLDQATKHALRSLARRHLALSAEIDDLDELIDPLVTAINPALMALNGVGSDSAGQLLITAGANVERLRSEAAFAMLCGTAPVPASSGRTHRHRLNRGGDRQANAALHRVVLSRLRWDPTTQAYMKRRREEGLSTREVIRCLKRHLAREIYTALNNPHSTTQTAA